MFLPRYNRYPEVMSCFKTLLHSSVLTEVNCRGRAFMENQSTTYLTIVLNEPFPGNISEASFKLEVFRIIFSGNSLHLCLASTKSYH